MELPSYIPAGYSLTEGVVEFYLNADSLQTENISAVSHDEKTYETYRLPADYSKNVRAVSLYYSDGAGNTLSYRVDLSFALSENFSIDFGALGTASSEKIKVPGFDAAMLIYDEAKTNGFLSIGYLYKEITSIDAIDIFSLNPVIQQSQVSRFGEDAANNSYTAVVYSIGADNLGKDEVIRIAESIR